VLRSIAARTVIVVAIVFVRLLQKQAATQSRLHRDYVTTIFFAVFNVLPAVSASI
jgi:hypothetical protein